MPNVCHIDTICIEWYGWKLKIVRMRKKEGKYIYHNKNNKNPMCNVSRRVNFNCLRNFCFFFFDFNFDRFRFSEDVVSKSINAIFIEYTLLKILFTYKFNCTVNWIQFNFVTTVHSHIAAWIWMLPIYGSGFNYSNTRAPCIELWKYYFWIK